MCYSLGKTQYECEYQGELGGFHDEDAKPGGPGCAPAAAVKDDNDCSDIFGGEELKFYHDLTPGTTGWFFSKKDKATIGVCASYVFSSHIGHGVPSSTFFL